MSGIESLTARMVANVRKAWQRNNRLYEQIFDSIDRLTLEAVKAINNSDLEHLGDLMNVCQGQLNSLQVSSWEIEEMIQLAPSLGPDQITVVPERENEVTTEGGLDLYCAVEVFFV